MAKKKNRVGEENFSNEGYKMLIVECDGYTNMIVEFQDEYKAKVKCRYDHFKNGEVKNPYHKSVFGKGYIGLGKYSRSTHPKIYNEWFHMLERCYDENLHKKYPTYIKCTTDNYFLCFQNFAKWYEENYYKVKEEIMCLDKDILFKRNTIYSPKTCIFVPNRINTLFIKADKSRGDYPIGINYDKKLNKLKVTCQIDKRKKHLGLFELTQVIEAFTCYKIFKENYIKQVADEYKDLIPTELYEAMYKYEVEIND